jgi:hypothetical protein
MNFNFTDLDCSNVQVTNCGVTEFRSHLCFVVDRTRHGEPAPKGACWENLQWKNLTILNNPLQFPNWTYPVAIPGSSDGPCARSEVVQSTVSASASLGVFLPRVLFHYHLWTSFFTIISSSVDFCIKTFVLDGRLRGLSESSSPRCSITTALSLWTWGWFFGGFS